MEDLRVPAVLLNCTTPHHLAAAPPEAVMVLPNCLLDASAEQTGVFKQMKGLPKHEQRAKQHGHRGFESWLAPQELEEIQSKLASYSWLKEELQK